ncbi:MAG: insulinase family protein [Clostridia bacterium]|nr:insulinase family protein [Clostridia bacterium]
MIKIKVFDNKTTLVYEQLPHIRSVCTGVWIKAGSRYETTENNGITHYLEHMFFKGTEKRSARDIADEFDGIGGLLNGFTGKEATCFYAKTLDMHFEKSVEILADMVCNSVLDGGMVERERQVIFEEMAMYADSPEDYVHEMLELGIWREDPLGYPITGTRESLQRIDGGMLREYMRNHMSPCNTVISVAGRFDEDEMTAVIEKYFGSLERDTGIEHNGFKKPAFTKGTERYEKDIEQTYISIALESEGYEDAKRYAMMAAASVLGGGMSSRLFQNLREDKGLVYSVGAENQTYSNTGILNIYAGTSMEKLDEALECIRMEVAGMGRNGITAAELDRVKEQLKGNFILGMESTSTRMSMMGKGILLKGRVESQDEVIEKINGLTSDDVLEAAGHVLDWDKAAISILSSQNQGVAEVG